MSKISLDLSNIKSAGVYTLEIDESQRVEQQATALRLLVGFNGKGPFNRPVFIQNEAQRQKVMGDIDTRLEKKGCFFNRAAKTMLETGPILTLNLLNVDDTYDGPDQVNYTSLSLDAGKRNPQVADAGSVYGEYDYLAETVDKVLYGTKSGDSIPFVGKAPYAAMYDRSRFWTPSESNLQNIAAIGLGASVEQSNFLNFANVGTDEISILVYKPDGLTGYDITAKEWYGGSENIPYGWIRPSDLISDYFIRVVAVKGNWSNYAVLSSDSVWGKYFDKKGVLKNKIGQFTAAEGISLIGSWTGVIIPDFVDKQGNYLYLKDRINSQTETTGLLMSINEDAMQVISYDLNGVDVETGSTTGRGAWVYDFDANGEGESEYGETEIGENGFIVDMVGHNFQNGVSKEKVWAELQTSFKSVIFDGSVGTLKADSSVFYLNDSSVLMSDATNITTVKTPEFEKAEPMRLYAVYDTTTNRRIKTAYSYIALTATAYDKGLSANKINSAVAYTADGKTMNTTIGQERGVEDASIKLKNDLDNNIKYVDTSVLFGNYGALSADTKQLYIFSVYSGAEGSAIDTVKTMDVSTMVKAEDASIAGEYKFNFANSNFSVKTDGKLFHKEEETGEISAYGVNFLSYNYLSDNSEEVLCNVRGAHYFNGKNNKAANPFTPVALEAGQLFGGQNPVNDDNLNMFIVTDEYEANNIQVGDYVENITFYNNLGDATKFGLIPGVTKIVAKVFVNVTVDNKFTYKGKKYTYDNTIGGLIRTATGRRGFYLFTAADAVLIDKNGIIVRQLALTSDVISKSLRFIPLKGLKISSRHSAGYDADGKITIAGGIEKIYSVLRDNGIRRGLNDENMISFRYVVDSMVGVPTSSMSKSALSSLADERVSCTALLNVGSAAMFANSTDPCFCDSYDEASQVKPAFDTKYIPLGGNLDMYSTTVFSLPSEEEGSKNTACFFPSLIYREKNHNIIVPPAADVSNTFNRKFMTGGDPYAITANRNGLIRSTVNSIVGLDYSADTEDRDNLEPFGINTIISENGMIMIYGNQTAYQEIKSDFNKLHVRENLNTLELACGSILKTYNFLHNTPSVRASIITALTPIFEAMKISGALAHYELVCDETNNTIDVIENDMCLVDVAVWMNRGMEKIVQRFTVKRRDTLPQD